ncbi:hypothetical protein BJV77DRAFT_965333 [Russula vinacea]|nr:hypothetical protein BJV77DRAFT_965333 [Russula vinacea]
MTGNECQTNGTKQEDADDDIREYLRGYKKKRHTPSGLPETHDDSALATQITQVMVGSATVGQKWSTSTCRSPMGWATSPSQIRQVRPDALVPTVSGTLGANHPVHTRLLRPKRCVPLAKVKDLTPTQLRLFNQTEPFLNWVEEALDSEADRGLTAGIYQYRYYLREIAQVEARMEREAKTLQLLVTHKMEALADLLAPTPTTASLTGLPGLATSTSRHRRRSLQGLSRGDPHSARGTQSEIHSSSYLTSPC